MSPSANARNNAMVALAKLQLDGVITGWKTNFAEHRGPGWVPQVSVTIAANDELALERTKRAVQKALEPHIKSIQVQVTALPGWRLAGRNDDSFDFGDEETE